MYNFIIWSIKLYFNIICNVCINLFRFMQTMKLSVSIKHNFFFHILFLQNHTKTQPSVCVLTFSISFLKTELLINLKNLFFTIIFCFLSSLYISMYGFNKVFWLNLVTLCTFCNNNTWSNAIYKILLSKTYYFLLNKFLIFLNFGIFLVKLLNHCVVSVTVQEFLIKSSLNDF